MKHEVCIIVESIRRLFENTTTVYCNSSVLRIVERMTRLTEGRKGEKKKHERIKRSIIRNKIK